MIPAFLLAARWACLLLLILHFLGGAGERGTAGGPRVAMADILFSLTLRLGTRWEWECTELPGWGALGTLSQKLFREALGTGSRIFLGTDILEFPLESLRGTVLVESKRRDRGGAGSWIQFRRLSWKGTVTNRQSNATSQCYDCIKPGHGY